MNAEMYCNRNSFDRFGDDLCQYLLSYLPLSDCFHYECVSKQWKRLIFDKQNKLTISTKERYLVVYNGNHYIINETSLKCLLRKCRSVSDLSIGYRVYLNDSVIDIISDNCQHLKSFQVYHNIDGVSHKCLNRFASKCRQTIEVINIICSYDRFKLLIDLLPNLTIIRFVTSKAYKSALGLSAPSINSLFITSDNKPVLPKLVQMTLSELCFINGFETIDDKYCKQIKRMTVVFDVDKIFDINHTLFNTFFANLTRFECLEKLVLNFIGCRFILDEHKCLKAIGEKCVKLSDLRIDGYYGDIGDCFANNFVSLKKLQLNDFDDALEEFGVRVECFKSCTHLTHLSLRYPNIIDRNFSEIDTHLPKLKYLQISGDWNQLTDITLRSVAKLTQLYCLMICCDDVNNNITDNGIFDLINNCVSVKCIELNMITKVSQKSLNEFIEKAKQIPKIEFKFSVTLGKPNRVIVKDMPKNLCLEIIV